MSAYTSLISKASAVTLGLYFCVRSKSQIFHSMQNDYVLLPFITHLVFCTEVNKSKLN